MRVDEAALHDYALGTLTTEEAQEVEAYLRARPERAALMRDAQDALAALLMSLPPQAPEPGVEEELLAYAREHLESGAASAAAAKRRGPFLVALGLAAALGLTAWVVFRPLSGRLDEAPAPPVAAVEPLPLLDEAGEEVAAMVPLADGSVYVAFAEDPGEAYRVWLVEEGGEPRLLEEVEGRGLVLPSLPQRGRLVVTRDSVDPLAEPWLELPQ